MSSLSYPVLSVLSSLLNFLLCLSNFLLYLSCLSCPDLFIILPLFFLEGSSALFCSVCLDCFVLFILFCPVLLCLVFLEPSASSCPVHYICPISLVLSVLFCPVCFFSSLSCLICFAPSKQHGSGWKKIVTRMKAVKSELCSDYWVNRRLERTLSSWELDSQNITHLDFLIYQGSDMFIPPNENATLLCFTLHCHLRFAPVDKAALLGSANWAMSKLGFLSLWFGK